MRDEATDLLIACIDHGEPWSVMVGHGTLTRTGVLFNAIRTLEAASRLVVSFEEPLPTPAEMHAALAARLGLAPQPGQNPQAVVDAMVARHAAGAPAVVIAVSGCEQLTRAGLLYLWSLHALSWMQRPAVQIILAGHPRFWALVQAPGMERVAESLGASAWNLPASEGAAPLAQPAPSVVAEPAPAAIEPSAPPAPPREAAQVAPEAAPEPSRPEVPEQAAPEVPAPPVAAVLRALSGEPASPADRLAAAPPVRGAPVDDGLMVSRLLMQGISFAAPLPPVYTPAPAPRESRLPVAQRREPRAAPMPAPAAAAPAAPTPVEPAPAPVEPVQPVPQFPGEPLAEPQEGVTDGWLPEQDWHLWTTPETAAWLPLEPDPVPADPVPADPVPADPVPADPVPAWEQPRTGEDPRPRQAPYLKLVPDASPPSPEEAQPASMVSDPVVHDPAPGDPGREDDAGRLAGPAIAQRSAEPPESPQPPVAVAWAVPERALLAPAPRSRPPLPRTGRRRAESVGRGRPHGMRMGAGAIACLLIGGVVAARLLVPDRPNLPATPPPVRLASSAPPPAPSRPLPAPAPATPPPVRLASSAPPPAPSRPLPAPAPATPPPVRLASSAPPPAPSRPPPAPASATPPPVRLASIAPPPSPARPHLAPAPAIPPPVRLASSAPPPAPSRPPPAPAPATLPLVRLARIGSPLSPPRPPIAAPATATPPPVRLASPAQPPPPPPPPVRVAVAPPLAARPPAVRAEPASAPVPSLSIVSDETLPSVLLRVPFGARGKTRADLAAEMLRRAGYVVSEQPGAGPAGVGFFFTQDRDSAASVGRLLAPTIGVLPVGTLPARSDPPPPGTVEVTVPSH